MVVLQGYSIGFFITITQQLQNQIIVLIQLIRVLIFAQSLDFLIDNYNYFFLGYSVFLFIFSQSLFFSFFSFFFFFSSFSYSFSCSSFSLLQVTIIELSLVIGASYISFALFLAISIVFSYQLVRANQAFLFQLIALYSCRTFIFSLISIFFFTILIAYLYFSTLIYLPFINSLFITSSQRNLVSLSQFTKQANKIMPTLYN